MLLGISILGEPYPRDHTLIGAYIFVFLDGPQVVESHQALFGQSMFVSLVSFLLASFPG